MKRISYSAARTVTPAATSNPCSPFEFLVRIRAARRVPRAATSESTLVASATRLMLRCR